MRSPTLAELPKAPPGRRGWPWTEQSPPVQSTMPDGAFLPRISIVTPSFNQGAFIEETIRSVLLQGYPDIEFLIIDGGSTDETLAIIRKYEPWLAHWVSEKDRGQSHALNKGLARVTGPIFGWLNSDDYYLPGALSTFAGLCNRCPDAVGWAAATQVINETGARAYVLQPVAGSREALGEWAHKAFIPQPSCLFAAERVRRVGGINEALYYTMDVELIMKLAGLGEFAVAPDVVTCFRLYRGCKTADDSLGGLVELISSDFNLGMPRVAEALLHRRMAGATGLAMDNLSASERCRLMDAVGYPDLARYILARLYRNLRVRLRRRHRRTGIPSVGQE